MNSGILQINGRKLNMITIETSTIIVNLYLVSL